VHRVDDRHDQEGLLIRAFATMLITVTLSVAWGAAPAVADHPDMMLGPGEAGVHDIGDEALIRTSKFGYIYIAGQQHTHLRVTFIKERFSLRYRDTGTKRLNSIPKRCDREKVKKGISVVCKIPKAFEDKRMFVQVWPRLGNDFVDGRTLPRKFRLWVLADAGRDVFLGGDGNDFVNGAKDGDRVFGGPGDDFLRTGPGNDRLTGGDGKDRLSCAEDYDTAFRDRRDSMYQCENVRPG
jgi:RTX calcium-binding nonapeptide repeat (4 copies)